MNTKRIVITGGPGTGKTSIINELIKRNYQCIEEISRQITLEAQQKGISQLFLTEPLLFSDLLLEGRLDQFHEAGKINEKFIFMDRGLPDIVTYLDFMGNNYPDRYNDVCHNSRYDHIFVLAPWQKIYQNDNERYESFDQALEIHEYLLKTYSKFDYELHDVPFGSVDTRADFILNISELL